MQRRGLYCFGAANGQLNAKRRPALFAGRFFRTAFGAALLWCALFFAWGTAPEAAAQHNGIAPPSAQTVGEPTSGNFVNVGVTVTGSWAPAGNSNGVVPTRLSSGSNTATLNTDGFCFPGLSTGDYYLQSGEFTITSGQTSQDIANALITICQDNDDEPDETFTIQWTAVNNTSIFNSSLTHCESNGYQCNTTFTIRDSNPTAASLARAGSGAVSEGGKIEFTVTLGRALVAGEIIDAPLSIGGAGVTTGDWSLAKKSGATNTGVSLQDTGTATPKVRFSGAGAQTATLELTATADGASEGGSETFAIALGSDSDFDATSLGTNVGGGADPDGTANAFSVTVNDLVPDPTITISADAASAQEGTAASFTVNASRAPGANLDVNLAVSQSGDFVASSDRGTKTVRINANATSATYSVPTVNDNVDESNGSVTVAVSQGNNYTVGSSSSATVTVTDNDAAPTSVRLSVNDSSVAEDDGATTITVTATVEGQTRFGTAKTVAVSVTGSGAANVVDFTASPSSFDITIAAGAQTGSASFTLTPTNDNVDEGDETVSVSGSVSGATTQGAAITLADDDAPPAPVASFASASATAAESAGTQNVTINLSPAPSANITLNYSLTGTATRGADYTISGVTSSNGSASVSGGDTSVNIPVAITDDSADEPNETLILTLTSGSGYDIGNTNAHTLTITDNDDPPPPPPATPVASFASASATAAESAGTQNVTINLSPAPSANITVNYSLSGTATLGADYTISGVTSSNGTISVSGGDTSVNIPVAITDDSADEPSETLILTLTSGSGYDIGSANAHTLTITDNDDAGGGGGGGGGGTGGGGGGGGGTGGGGSDPSEVTLSVAPNPVVEGEEITVTISLSQLASSAVTIPLVLNAGTAEAGDYGALASIVVEANQPSGTGVIATTKDDDKDDETFTVALGTLPAGLAAGAPASVQVTITDATTTSIESPADEIPTAFALEQNYPNPFNPTTTIVFALNKTQHVTLAVYDLLGQEVQVLVDGVRPAARYRVPFDATDLASGTYLYVLRTETQTAVKTMALLK